MAPFVAEQAEALRQAGCTVELFKVEGHGVLGYLRNLRRLKDAIKQFKPDTLHAHYGLCGLLCTLQHKMPVVVTYHGSDINDSRILPLSRIAMRRATHNIFVSEKLMRKASISTSNCSILPCGINLEDFPIVDRAAARHQLGLDKDSRYILFAGAFDNPVKNASLAKAATAMIPDARLLELKGYDRSEVALLMNAVDALLMTSHNEGSPQVIKEALAVGLPIVSVDVGDVAWLTEGVEGCHIAHSHDAEALAGMMQKVLSTNTRTNGRQKIEHLNLDNAVIAKRLISIHEKISKR